MKRLLLALCLTFGTLPAFAAEPGSHPAYIHALSDLHSARWLVQHRDPENPAVERDQRTVDAAIHDAAEDLRHAAAVDAKPLTDVPRDVAELRQGKMHAAIQLLQKVRSDISSPESDPRARPLQQSAIGHIDEALAAARRISEER